MKDDSTDDDRYRTELERRGGPSRVAVVLVGVLLQMCIRDRVVTVILHSTGEWDAISRRISASRVMSVPFVATAAPKP